MAVRGSAAAARSSGRTANLAYPDGFSARGRPLCAFGIELARRGADHARRRTKFCCEHRCRDPDTEPADGWQDCAHLARPGAGYTFYTGFDWSYRKFGPLTPDMGLFDKLYQLRTDVERGFGLTKTNRYRMEQSITVMGLDAVSIYVTLHDTAVVIDALQRGRPPLRPSDLPHTLIMPGSSLPDTLKVDRPGALLAALLRQHLARSR